MVIKDVVNVKGLVLEGGGAKGAYHIGAYKAIDELGIEINGVTGTSIGAINGAFIAQGDWQKAYELWYSITLSKVFDIEEEYINDVKNMEFTYDNLRYFKNVLKDIISNRGIDTKLMRKILDDNINENKLRKSSIDFGMVTVSLTDVKPLELFIEEITDGKVKDYLMASASLPIFKNNKVDGKAFLDGGFYDNLPVNMLINKGYRDFITIRTNGIGITRKIARDDVKIVNIQSNDDLGHILKFESDSTRKNLELGYYDALKLLTGLKGNAYYVKPQKDDEYYIDFLFNIPKQNIIKAGKSLGIEDMPAKRLLMEEIIPRIADHLNVSDNAGYEDIVIAGYEFLAKKYGLNRFKVYEFGEFQNEIKKKMQPFNRSNTEAIPKFVRQRANFIGPISEEIFQEVIFALLESEGE